MDIAYPIRDGKRPAWLTDTDMVRIKTIWGGAIGRAVPISNIQNWFNIDTLFLSPDHWAAPVILAGYEPWSGGDSAPADYDRDGAVMFRNGRASIGGDGLRWTHFGEYHDIIGYKRRPDAVEPMAPSGISECNVCGERYLSQPTGTDHKCGRCNGRCYPIGDDELGSKAWVRRNTHDPKIEMIKCRDAAQRLAKTLHAKHYDDDKPGWTVADSLDDVLAQIDNMTAGLCRYSERDAATLRACIEAVEAVKPPSGDGMYRASTNNYRNEMIGALQDMLPKPPAAPTLAERAASAAKAVLTDDTPSYSVPLDLFNEILKALETRTDKNSE